MIAASAYPSSTTVNVAEYTGMNYGMQAALENKVLDFIIVGDSRLAIQQCMGVIACKKESLQAMLDHHNKLVTQFNSFRYLHVILCYNATAISWPPKCSKTKLGQLVE